MQDAIVDATATATDNSITWDTLPFGIVSVIHLLHPEPKFEGRTRLVVLHPEVYAPIKATVQAHIETILSDVLEKLDA